MLLFSPIIPLLLCSILADYATLAGLHHNYATLWIKFKAEPYSSIHRTPSRPNHKQSSSNSSTSLVLHHSIKRTPATAERHTTKKKTHTQEISSSITGWSEYTPATAAAPYTQRTMPQKLAEVRQKKIGRRELLRGGEKREVPTSCPSLRRYNIPGKGGLCSTKILTTFTSHPNSWEVLPSPAFWTSSELDIVLIAYSL